jgi:hypothetical protein
MITTLAAFFLVGGGRLAWMQGGTGCWLEAYPYFAFPRVTQITARLSFRFRLCGGLFVNNS